MLFRFHHILVPVDITGRSKAALDIAFDLAVENNVRVTLLHVIQTIGSDDDAPDDETQQFYDRLQERVDSELNEMAKRFREAEIDVVVRTPVGDRLREIASFGSEQEVDLIVMSSHRVDPENLAASWGTLSYRVSVVCDNPILLVK
ncbi:MAG: universal stress protein [Planctomycetaceae bacterium]|jgi:nucleotide-binding universal stress UspA family protein